MEARTRTYAQAIQEALAEEMERDERVFVLGEDVGVWGNLYGCTKGLLERFGSDRVLDTPIAEAGSQAAPWAVPLPDFVLSSR